MAEKDYLSDLYYSPSDTGMGMAGGIIAQNLPAVVNPYASPGANFAAVLGGGLLAGLLAYGAKREAEAQNKELTPKLLDVMSATNQTELQQKLAQPGYEQLGGLGTRLQSALVEQQRKQAMEEAKQAAQLKRQQQLEDYKATLMNNPDVQQALRTKLSIEQQFAPPSVAAALPLTLEQREEIARAEARGKALGQAEAAVSKPAQQAASEKSTLRTKEYFDKKAIDLQNGITIAQERGKVASLNEEQRQANRKELEGLKNQLKQVLQDKQIAAKYDVFEKKWDQKAQELKLGAADKARVDSLMNIARRVKDAASKMREVPNYASLKMAEFLPMFDDNLAISDLRDVQSLAVIQRTGAAASVPEFKRLQEIIQNPRATPAELVARLERFVELATQDAESIVASLTKSPEELIGDIRAIRGPRETFAQLQAAYKENKISKDDYQRGLLKLKAEKTNG